MYLTPVLLQGMGESVRHCLLKFALSFIVVSESDIISAILELKGETHNDTLMIACLPELSLLCSSGYQSCA